MKTWTNAARERLDSYLGGRVLKAGFEPEEAAEVVEDWRLHVEEEVARLPGTVVDVLMLETVFARMGEGEKTTEWKLEPPYPAVPPQPLKPKGVAVHWIFGVIFPSFLIVFEALAGFCESVFFDPIPTWFHFVLLMALPVGNGWLLKSLERRKSSPLTPLIVGFNVAVSAFYALLFLPLLPASVIAILIFGLGFLSLMPIFTWVSTWVLGRRLREMGGVQSWRGRWRVGALVGLLALAALEVGPLVTRVGLHRAMSEDPEVAQAGLAQLRSFHSQRTLLRACYEGNRGTTMATDISGWMMRGWQLPLTMLGSGVIVQHDSLEARDVFYRVTGIPFNRLRPPTWVTGNQWVSRGDAWNQVEFDDHLGGDEVAVRLSGLSMSESRLDAQLDRASGLGYVEWIAEFTNESPVAREARFQVLLPERGVVSRVSLWINGEPREAAFASKAKVKAAYQEVAVAQRRDPILVTACGPGRAMVQCFPILENGGTMKIRLGMVAPLREGRLSLPVILERNFSMKKGLEHAVWVQSEDSFHWGSKKRASLKDGKGQTLQVAVEAGGLDRDEWFAQLLESDPAAEVWCNDPFAEDDENLLRRTWQEGTREPLERCVVVLDGSFSLAPYQELLESVLGDSALESVTTILLADDQWEEVSRSELKNITFSGGRDNVPALAEALQLARGKRAAVVWIHGAQPLKSSNSERLLQLLERTAAEVPLYSVALEPGGNRILESIFKYRAIRTGPRQVAEEGRLRGWMHDLVQGGGTREVVWRREAAKPEGEDDSGKVWDLLARWWAAEEVREARRQQEPDPETIALAARYQLVTAYSGAVVLETAEQYERHGLEPVGADTVSSLSLVPEPDVVVLIGVALMSLAWRRRRKN